MTVSLQANLASYGMSSSTRLEEQVPMLQFDAALKANGLQADRFEPRSVSEVTFGAAAIALDVQRARKVKDTVETKDGTRRFTAYIPAGFEDQSERKAIILEHGASLSALLMRMMTFLHRRAMKEGVMVVYVDAARKTKEGKTTRRQPNDGSEHTLGKGIDDMGCAQAVKAKLEQDYEVQQTALAGYSRGGGLALWMDMENAQAMDAFVAVDTNMLREHLDSGTLSNQTPIFWTFGTKDHFYPEDGGDEKAGGWGLSLRRILTGKTASHQETLDELLRRRGGVKSKASEILGPIERGGRIYAIKYVYETHSGAPVVVVKVIGGGHTWPGSWLGKALPKGYVPLLGWQLKGVSLNDLIMEFLNANMPPDIQSDD